jgi:hypothetical protein
MDFGSDTLEVFSQSNQGDGATDRLITHRTSSAVLQAEDCTFTTAQSPAGLQRRHVRPDPLNPARRTAGPTMSLSAEREAA